MREMRWACRRLEPSAVPDQSKDTAREETTRAPPALRALCHSRLESFGSGASQSINPSYGALTAPPRQYSRVRILISSGRCALNEPALYCMHYGFKTVVRAEFLVNTVKVIS